MNPLPKPPSLVLKWSRLLLAFGVSVSLGLAPLLGKLPVPGFRSLLSLFPASPFDTASTVVPLAALLMGVVAVGVQFYGARHVEWTRLDAVFRRMIRVILVCSLVLLFVHIFSVVEVPVQEESVSVLVGFSRPTTCAECEEGMSNVECLGFTTLKPGRILSCWSETQIKWAFWLMAISYLATLCSFGVLVGVVTLQSTPDGS